MYKLSNEYEMHIPTLEG